MVGRTISHYKILDKVGEGGMGVVYRAEDMKLGRNVALKFLSPDALASSDLKARFFREARAAAALDHPNICTVHEIDEADGQVFLCMPFIEGESLHDKISRRPLPLDEALDLAIQIADGLHAAHEKEIVHRDIKSANVMVDGDGRAKITDFGLARLTGQTTITKPGTTLGTPAYMSPEQVQGEAGDRRSDIWSLGIVIYEMVTGRLPYSGPGAQAVGNAILHAEPEPATALRSGLPVELDRIIAKCLAKSADDRYHHADDVAVDLRSVRRHSQVTSTELISSVPRGERRSLLNRVLPWAIAVTVIVVAIVALVVLPQGPSAELPVTRALVTLPEGQSMPLTDAVDALAVSGDGTQVAYITGQASATQIHLRPTDGLEDQVLTGSEGAQLMFFSPDDQWLAFVAEGQLKKVLLEGGSPLALGRVGDSSGGFWADDGHIYFGNKSEVGIWRVPEDGGKPERLTTPDNAKGEYFHYDPIYFSDSDSILFMSADGSHGQHRLHVKDLASGEQRLLVEGGSSPRYLPTGHLLYLQGNSVLAAVFDSERGEITGPPMPVLQDVRTTMVRAQLAVSGNGVVVSMLSQDGSSGELGSQLVWVNRQGAVEPVTEELRGYMGPRLSPDGRSILTWIAGGSSQEWVFDLERGTLTRLTQAGDNYWSTWSPDGLRIAFLSMRGGAQNLFVIPSNGSAAAEQLTSDEFGQQPLAWTPDGATIICHQQVHPETGWDIVTVSLEDDHKPNAYLNGTSDEFQPALSPDGRWLAYVSDETGRNEVYVTSFPQAGAKRVVSTGGGTEPLWNPAGGELFYRLDQKVFSVSYTSEPEFRPGMPELLFEKRFNLAPQYGRNYDVSADGQRFLMLYHESSATGVNQYVLTTNWFSELLRRAPVDAAGR